MSDEFAPKGPFSKMKALGDALFGGGLLSGLAAVVAAIFAAFSHHAADQAQNQLQSSRLLFDRDHAQRQDQLAIYERVESNLNEKGPTGVVISASYAKLVDDVEVRSTLCSTVLAVARGRLADKKEGGPKMNAAIESALVLMKDCTQNAELEVVVDPNGVGKEALRQTTAQASVLEAQAQAVESAAPIMQVVSSAEVSATGWDIDVFSCPSAGDAGKALAGKASAALAKVSNENGTVGGQHLGRIRLRSLTPAAAANFNYKDNVVAGDASEAALSASVATMLNTQVEGGSFRRAGARGRTPWYLSVFVCR